MSSPDWRAPRRRFLGRGTDVWGGRGTALAIGAVVLVVVAAALLFSALIASRAADAGVEGKQSLVAAQTAIGARDIDATRAHLQEARSWFRRVHTELDRLGPLGPMLRVVPFLRVQTRAVEAYADAGDKLAAAGEQLAEAAGGVLDPPDPNVPVGQALEQLRVVEATLTDGIEAVDAAAHEIAALDGYRLVGPLDDARHELAARLPDVRQQAVSAQEGIEAFITFAGGDGPRRYLVFSQNPDEPRPTGGFIGTYGVLVADGTGLHLERYDDIAAWPLHPAAFVPADEAPTAFRIPDPPVVQGIANVNATPDFPAAAELGMRLWEGAGDVPVDGVVSFTPELLARLVGVLGPVEVATYGETVTGDNLIERLDFHTHDPEARVPGVGRKQFIADLADVVLHRLLDAPARTWDGLAEATGRTFDRREAMAWTDDPFVRDVLVAHSWHGGLPAVAGDFFYNAEFAYASKNGRGIRRTFDHDVELRDDGSGTVTTTVTIRNTRPFDPVGAANLDTLSYVTVYGPLGAELVDDPADPGYPEPPVAGHPAAGWLRSAPPEGEDTLTVRWEVPELATRNDDGTWRYSLRWLRLPGSTGDEVLLSVSLPAGWQWTGTPPPERIELTDDVDAAWSFGSAGALANTGSD